jgi:hypothetical protein
MAAPLGNQNAAKARLWTAAIERALERRKPANERIKAIDELADKLINSCYKGELSALQELGNRLEGKPAQGITVAGDGDSPIKVSHKVEFVGDSPAAEEA